ncbi:MAG: hypothetical protein WDO68_09330 [Gammaproteobacteria bacterium]
MIEGSTRGGLRRSMKLGAISAVAMALSLSLAPAAHAAQAAWMAEADENAEVLDDGASPEGKTTWGSSVQFSGPGKLTVSAYDLGVANTLMERLDSLSFSVSNSTNLLGSHTGDGTMSFGIDGPGSSSSISMHWSRRTRCSKCRSSPGASRSRRMRPQCLCRPASGCSSRDLRGQQGCNASERS